MSVRFTKLILQADGEERTLLIPGSPHTLEEIRQLSTVAEFCRMAVEDISITAEHYRFGDEGPEYDADQNHLLLIDTYNTLADEIQCLPFCDGSIVDFMRGYEFTVLPKQTNKKQREVNS
ncbi:hypothetical protein DS742_17385 [Lacrimispora amygdalina]|uniref:DUF3846 domain-containing protein n=1 Tax=Lacrimispora amygdalina TaxID=253257 RepID=A0A3E2N999_9FIRM|nr:hypothetical protein [Clostridium indicum]RFZ77588.1 hypothetical protein DS742_17385 [Clostridium indicum]